MQSKPHHKQGLSAFEFITMVFSLFLVAGIASPIIKRNVQGAHVDLAKQDAERLAGSLLRRGLSEPKSSRGIASVEDAAADAAKGDQGMVGQDPWGRAYHFKYLRNKDGMPNQIFVWSDGPDGKPESRVEDGAPPQLLGDDIGSITNLR